MNTTTVEPTTTTLVVPVLSRLYSIVSLPKTTPKGKQRQIVLNILQREGRPMSISEISEIWEKEFISINRPVDTVMNSVRYHLHHTTLLGQTKY